MVEEIFRNLILIEKHNSDNGSDNSVSVSPTLYQANPQDLFRNLVPSEPKGKILYQDKEVIWQIYCACTTFSKSLLQVAKYDQNSAKWPYVFSRDFLLSNLGLNLDRLTLLLSSDIPHKHIVDDLVDEIEAPPKYLIDQELAYPGMPVRIAGKIQIKQNLLRKGLLLQGDSSSTRLVFREENHLFSNPEFLREHYFFILGIIVSLDVEITVEVGAILL